MNLKNEHGQSVLARNSLGERKVEMKAISMYRTVNILAPSRGSSTRICIAMPKTEYLKKVSVMIDLKFGTRCLMK